MFLLRMHTRAVNITNEHAHFHFKEMDLNDKKNRKYKGLQAVLKNGLRRKPRSHHNKLLAIYHISILSKES